MSIVTQRYMLGVSPGINSPRIRCSMGDTARDIKLLLYDSEGMFNIPSGVSAVVKGTKSNNVGFLHSCIVGSNYVIFTIVEDMSDIPGIVICEIQLTDSNGGIIGTSNFVIQVENPALSDDSDIGDVDTDIITGIITDIEVYKSSVNEIVSDYKDETDQAIEGLRATVGNDVSGIRDTVNNAVSVLNSRMDLALQELNKHEVQTVLFEDTTNPLAYIDDTATLEADPTTFDYIDFYYKTHVNDSGHGNWDKVFRFEPNSLFPTIVSVQPSDQSATNKTLYVHELSFNLSGNVITVLRSRRWYWSGNTSNSANVQQSSASSGTAPDNMYGGRVYKIVGVNISDIDELTDLRIGADGTVYQSAGTAIRTQFSNISGVYKLSVPGSSAVLSGNLTSGDFAKAYSAFTSGKGVYAVKDGEVYQLVDASSSSMSYCNIYIGAMKAIKKIVTYSNDTFEMSVNFINGSFVSYDNTNSGLSATNVQDAIDENTEELANVNGRLGRLGEQTNTIDRGEMNDIESLVYKGLTVTRCTVANGTVSNPGNVNAVNTSNYIPCAAGDTVTIYPVRALPEGHVYYYAYATYDESQQIVNEDYHALAKNKTVMIKKASVKFIRFAIFEIDEYDESILYKLRANTFYNAPVVITRSGNVREDLDAVIERLDELGDLDAIIERLDNLDNEIDGLGEDISGRLDEQLMTDYYDGTLVSDIVMQNGAPWDASDTMPICTSHIPCAYGKNVTLFPAKEAPASCVYRYAYAIYDGNGDALKQETTHRTTQQTVRIEYANAVSIRYSMQLYNSDTSRRIPLRVDTYNAKPYAVVYSDSVKSIVEENSFALKANEIKVELEYGKNVGIGSGGVLAYLDSTKHIVSAPLKCYRGKTIYIIPNKDFKVYIYARTGEKWALATGGLKNNFTFTFTDEDTYLLKSEKIETVNGDETPFRLYSSVDADLNEIKTQIKNNDYKHYDDLLSQSRYVLDESNSRVLTLLHFSDVHGNGVSMEYAMGVYNSLSGKIDDMLHTGDTVYMNYADGIAKWITAGCANSVLNVIGNHDTEVNLVLQAAGKDNVYNTFFAPYISNWGVVQPSGVDDSESADYHALYYYKDYGTPKIRLIVLDTNFWDSAQSAWLTGTLASAKEGGYAVILACHNVKKLTAMTDSNFSSYDGSGITETGNSYANQPDNWLDPVADFMDAGGEFICVLAGHNHDGKMGYLTLYPNIFCFVCDKASIARTGGAARIEGEINANTVNIVTVNATEKLFKIVKIGAEVDGKMRGRHVFCYDYANKRIVSQW